MSEVPELRGAAEQNLSGRGGSEVYRGSPSVRESVRKRAKARESVGDASAASFAKVCESDGSLAGLKLRKLLLTRSGLKLRKQTTSQNPSPPP